MRVFLFGTPCNAAAGQIIGRHLHRHLITRQNANEVHAQFAGNMGQNYVAIGKLYRNMALGRASFTMPSSSITSCFDMTEFILRSFSAAVKSPQRCFAAVCRFESHRSSTAHGFCEHAEGFFRLGFGKRPVACHLQGLPTCPVRTQHAHKIRPLPRPCADATTWPLLLHSYSLSSSRPGENHRPIRCNRNRMLKMGRKPAVGRYRRPAVFQHPHACSFRR